MNSIIRTTEEGWGCIPELKQASECLEETRHETYEIDNCVRSSELEDLVSNLKSKLESAIGYLDGIDTDVKIERVEEI